MMLAAILGLVVLLPIKAAAFDDDDYTVIRRHSFIENGYTSYRRGSKSRSYQE